MDKVEEVLDFWCREVGEAGWFAVDAAVDAAITDRFGGLWAEARAGGFRSWCDSPRGCLAYIVVTDQFPRNMFRGRPEAFATDALALDCAHRATAAGLDLQVPEPERVFFYMPFEHSEDPADQEISVRLTETRLPQTGAGFGLHARAHREVIRRFGRFPFRNAALGRETSADEAAFLADGGYGAVVRALGT